MNMPKTVGLMLLLALAGLLGWQLLRSGSSKADGSSIAKEAEEHVGEADLTAEKQEASPKKIEPRLLAIEPPAESTKSVDTPTAAAPPAPKSQKDWVVYNRLAIVMGRDRLELIGELEGTELKDAVWEILKGVEDAWMVESMEFFKVRGAEAQKLRERGHYTRLPLKEVTLPDGSIGVLREPLNLPDQDSRHRTTTGTMDDPATGKMMSWSVRINPGDSPAFDEALNRLESFYYGIRVRVSAAIAQATHGR